MNLLCSAGKGLCHGFCARKLWNAGRAKELPGSVFPASTPQSLSCMIHHPPSLPSSPCPALPVPPWHSHTSSGQAGPGSRNGTCSQIQGFGISQPSKGLGAGMSRMCPPAPLLCLFLLPASRGFTLPVHVGVYMGVLCIF